ncbi:unnamed protein product [Rotaria sordida]|uniref:Uncharacterized protein n=1 Tax=Rotaria sordida TaxID=392033 RepID=A0A815JEN2_9BILA|nr:unnamed protein product [Rotaria sordida]
MGKKVAATGRGETTLEIQVYPGTQFTIWDLPVNKFDEVGEDEQHAFREQVHREIQALGLKNVNKVFFVSAKHPQMFPDWMTMVDYLTN